MLYTPIAQLMTLQQSHTQLVVTLCNYVARPFRILQRVIKSQKGMSTLILTQERLIVFPFKKIRDIWLTFNRSFISWINKKFHCYHLLMRYLHIREPTLTWYQDQGSANRFYIISATSVNNVRSILPMNFTHTILKLLHICVI